MRTLLQQSPSGQDETGCKQANSLFTLSKPPYLGDLTESEHTQNFGCNFSLCKKLCAAQKVKEKQNGLFG